MCLYGCFVVLGCAVEIMGRFYVGFDGFMC